MQEINLLNNHLNGRSIFKKVIPTVNTLNNLIKRLDEVHWDIKLLNNWEKPIYKAYLLDAIKSQLIHVKNDERIDIIKKHILKTDSNFLGSHPICIYLIAYFLQRSENPSLNDFKEFCIKNNISDKDHSASAIWQVGLNDGKFLNLFNDQYEIIDIDFFLVWTKQSKTTVVADNIPSIKNHLCVQQTHLDYFLSLPEDNRPFKGPNSLNWAEFVCGDTYNYPMIFNQNFYRDVLLDFCNSKTTSDLFALLAVLSWGGMRRDHGKRLLENNDSILEIVHKLRNDHFTNRQQAFEYIHQKRSLGLLPGLGIGYYTKLICFLAPSLNGYIMDQWLAKSINLIFKEDLIHLANDWVSDKNNSSVYELFCNKIDYLSSLTNLSGYKTEEKLFSIGGHKKGLWRKYLIENY